jgi:hypothetical protein
MKHKIKHVFCKFGYYLPNGKKIGPGEKVNVNYTFKNGDIQVGNGEADFVLQTYRLLVDQNSHFTLGKRVLTEKTIT